MVLNFIWIGFFLIGFAVAVVRLFQGDTTIFTQVLTGIFDTAKTGFDISLGLVGVMSLWLGLMKVGENAGVIQLFAACDGALLRQDLPRRAARPSGGRLDGDEFLGQHARPGQRRHAAGPEAMKELQDLNPQKDIASNAMIMFLVLNTAGIT
ncbi:spore maturation protein A [Ditylenchus destructor]|nr:spore maturation protein A [Ditylenchus destructor]